MKKIKHLELSPFQKLSREEQRHVLAGTEPEHRWMCRCISPNDRCEEVWTYRYGDASLWDLLDGGINLNPVSLAKYIYQLIPFERYQVHILRKIEHGTKDHVDGPSGVRFL